MSTNETDFLKQQIIDSLKNDYGINVSTLTSLPWGADTNASVYKVQAQNQVSYFLKVKRDHHSELSVALTSMLYDTGIQLVIPPIKTKQGQLSQYLGAFTIIVYPFVEGENGFNKSLSKEQWSILGKTLRRIHELHIPLSIQNQIRQERFTSKWREALRSVYIDIKDKNLSLSDEVALKLFDFMKKNHSVIYQLIEKAHALSQKIKEQPTQFVLCHSDIHAGNILIADEKLYIVDWDEPILAPKERDLMFIGAGVGNVWNQPPEETDFYKGYGKTAVNQTMLAYYRYERIVEDIAIYAQALLLSASGGKNRLVMYKHFIDMFEPNGVVEIAFKTDKPS